MTKRLDPAFVQQEIINLLIACPELQEDEVLRSDMVEGSTEAHAFLSEVVRRIQAAQATQLGIATYLSELRERRDRMERREEALRGLAFKVMQTAQLSKAELPEATLSIRQGPRKVIVINEAEIPESCIRIIREPNKAEIRTLLMGGAAVPGCVLSNAEPVLAVRVK
ncbi:MAG TPA: siphovirus Gp157 family protein [Candidatus Acidoferrum sp.]